MKTENTKNEQMETARIRFGLIAPMVQGLSQTNPWAAYCRRVAAFPGKTAGWEAGTVQSKDADEMAESL